VKKIKSILIQPSQEFPPNHHTSPNTSLTKYEKEQIWFEDLEKEFASLQEATKLTPEERQRIEAKTAVYCTIKEFIEQLSREDIIFEEIELLSRESASPHEPIFHHLRQSGGKIERIIST